MGAGCDKLFEASYAMVDGADKVQSLWWGQSRGDSVVRMSCGSS